MISVIIPTLKLFGKMGGKPSKSEPAEPELENPELTKSQKVSATLVAGKEAAAKGLGAAAASVGSVFDKGKPKAQAAWGWTKQGAADSYDATRIFFSDGLGSTAEMAVCEAKFRTARSRLQADKKDFGERILESLVAECGDALTSPKGGRCVGCLRDGSDALQLYTEAQAKFKEHEEAMAAARKEYEEVRAPRRAPSPNPAPCAKSEPLLASRSMPTCAPPPLTSPTPISNLVVAAQGEGQGHLEGGRGVRLGQQEVGRRGRDLPRAIDP